LEDIGLVPDEEGVNWVGVNDFGVVVVGVVVVVV
jgi:hypothetical protein